MRWRPFQLRPSTPAAGIPKGPGPRVGARLKEAGRSVGIDFTGKCDRYPNTLASHALLKHAGEQGAATQNALQEVLFRRYFTDGEYPAGSVLEAAASEVGMDGARARQFAECADVQAEVAGEARANSSLRGITGVPFFVINGKSSLSGAQPPEAFVAAFKRA